ncbi:hypothetical protein XELAEV_18017765mg [Xenopus laevis]|uniref:Uncharacterized protein n=1 Tax=Xenopus laevis TaxID=8355 RepID=A0A974HT03_XENLA|nr:hypothetical protein XELAEV_18017765mg [Xenopus laevis]
MNITAVPLLATDDKTLVHHICIKKKEADTQRHYFPQKFEAYLLCRHFWKKQFSFSLKRKTIQSLNITEFVCNFKFATKYSS